MTTAAGAGPDPAATTEPYPGGSHPGLPGGRVPMRPPGTTHTAEDVPAEHSEAPQRSQALDDVRRCRMEQVVKHGHTLEADRQRSLHDMVKVAATQMTGALDYAHFRRSDAARRYLVRTAALCLAAIDWIDAEAAETKTGEASPHAGPAEDRT